MDLETRTLIRSRIQKITWMIVVFTILAGLKWPLIGWIVPVVMIIGIVGGFIRGRFVCGWLCPRGAFYDQIIPFVSPKRKIMPWVRHPVLRWSVFVVLMGFMVFQISQDPGNVYHWGKVFVRICIITTAIGVLIALFVHPRTWCTFCPIGTIQSVSGGHKHKLRMTSKEECIRCRICEKVCPMNLSIIDNLDEKNTLKSNDCIRCYECVRDCPKNILDL